MQLKEILKPSSAIDEGWSWVVLLAAFLVSGFTWGIQQVFGIIYSFWLNEFKASKAMTAWITSLPVFLLFCLSPVFNILMNRYRSYRKLGLVGTLLCSLSLILSSYVTNVYHLFITYSLLMGLGLLLLATPIVLIVTQYFVKYISAAVAVATVGAFVMSMAMPPLITHLLEVYSWRKTLRIMSLVVLVVCSISVMFWKMHSNEMKSYENISNKNVMQCLRSYIDLIKDKQFFIYLVANILFSIEFLISFTHLVHYAIELGIPRYKANWLPTFISIGNIIGRIAFGRIFDMKCINKIYLFIFLVYLTAVIVLIGSFSYTFTHLAVFTTIYGIFDGSYKAQHTVMMKYIASKEKLTDSFTLTQFCQSFGLIFGPVIVGFISDITKDYRIMFFIVIIATTTGGTTLLFLDKSKRPEETIEKENVAKRRKRTILQLETTL